MLTTYGMVLHNASELKGLGKVSFASSAGIDVADDEADDGADDVADDVACAGRRGGVTWDYMFLDEGHKIKNPKMQLSQKLCGFAVRHRIIVTGTPLQNNLQEVHALMSFVAGDVLGDRKDFKFQFERPITTGLDRHATAREREIGKRSSTALQSVLSQYVLRREKDKVFRTDNGNTNTHAGEGGEAREGREGEGREGGEGREEGEGRGREGYGGHERATREAGRLCLPSLSHVVKHDLVVWLQMLKGQQRLYMAFLQTESVFKALNKTGSALSALTILKKICDHTNLLTQHAANQIEHARGGKGKGREGEEREGEGRKEGREEGGGGEGGGMDALAGLFGFFVQAPLHISTSSPAPRIGSSDVGLQPIEADARSRAGPSDHLGIRVLPH